MMKKLTSILLALCLTAALAVPAFATQFTDAHGNVIELDDTLEAYTEAALFGADNAARKCEINLGDLWTDALRWFAVSGKINGFFEEDDVTAGNNAVWVDADHIVALWNGGNLRADVAAGKFGAAELAQVLPYPNKVAVVYMTGAQLVEALEAASEALPYSESTAAACASFMQVAGLKYTVDLAKPYDKGEAYGKSWFKAASLGRVTITEVNGKAFDESETYAVITSNANFNGMDSSYVFKEAAEAKVKSTVTTAVVRDVVWMYLSEELGSVVRESDYGKAQGRITLSVAGTLAYARRQTVEIDGRKVELATYALKDANGYETNYVRIRDVAQQLSGTKAQFAVEWDGAVSLVTGAAYAADGSEGKTPFTGDRAYALDAAATKIDGAIAALDTIVLTDDNGGGYTYYKLRDLGSKLGFNVGWTAERGIFVESDKPYEG